VIENRDASFKNPFAFLTEGLFLGFFGAIAGNIIGIFVLLILHSTKLNFTFGNAGKNSLAPQIPINEIIISLIVVIIVSALASLQPALKASKMEPVEALRHV